MFGEARKPGPTNRKTTTDRVRWFPHLHTVTTNAMQHQNKTKSSANQRPPGTFDVLVWATRGLLAPFFKLWKLLCALRKHYREERGKKTVLKSVRNHARAGLFHNKKQRFTGSHHFPPTCSTMEVSGSQAVSSLTVVIRQRPVITIAPKGPPPKRVYVSFLHPANGLPFLDLPACDYDCCPQVPNGGIHYGTALSARC